MINTTLILITDPILLLLVLFLMVI